MNSRRVWVLALWGLLWAQRGAAQGRDVVVCAQCHGNRAFFPADSKQGGFYVTDSTLEESRHRTLRCTACHNEYASGFPHQAKTRAVRCQTCHAGEGAEWAASIHATGAGRTAGDAPTCVECHGAHTVLGADDRRSPTHPLNVAALCGRCHSDPRIIGTYFMAPGREQARVAVGQYFQTVHGMALTRAGLTVSATCNDCHGAHRILPAKAPESSVNRAHVAETCGNCHQGVLETYRQSIHGQVATASAGEPGGPVAPVCTDCHAGHRIVRADQPDWFIGVVKECGTCHQDLYATYSETYHGKVTRLGFGLTAKCSDCHTAHDIRPASDPKASVFPLNLVGTCQRCHPAANANFVEYYAHGDPRRRTRYPMLFWPWVGMTLLLVGVFTFFGLHTALWLTRVGIERARARRAAQGRKEEP